VSVHDLFDRMFCSPRERPAARRAAAAARGVDPAAGGVAGRARPRPGPAAAGVVLARSSSSRWGLGRPRAAALAAAAKASSAASRARRLRDHDPARLGGGPRRRLVRRPRRRARPRPHPGPDYFTGSRPSPGHRAPRPRLHRPCWPWLSPAPAPRALLPDHFRPTDREPHHDIVFDILVAVTLTLSATAIGVMAAFALVFVPPWVAFRFAQGWRARSPGRWARGPRVPRRLRRRRPPRPAVRRRAGPGAPPPAR